MKTAFEKYVAGANPAITYVVSGHLWIEHLLVRALQAVLPRPEALLRGPGLSFPVLVSLCEAQGIVQADFAEVLRRVNTFRNRYAHRLSFEPADHEVEALLQALREMEQPFFVSTAPASERELMLAVATTCGFLERRVRELGVTDIEPA